MVVLDGGAYCGIAPVPGGRVNIGIVLTGPAWRASLARDGAAATAEQVLRADPAAARRDRGLARRAGLPTRSRARARWAAASRDGPGPGWLVVGDAAGFLDPFTGEGLHRALVSARLAAAAIDRGLRMPGPLDLAPYERAMRARFRSKDVVSRLVLSFLARPALFDGAATRLAERDDIRATMGLVMGDLVPASRALDPRFLAGLLRP